MIELGLSRVFRLLAKTPLPWRAIHVAGTNGKGSICAYISAMLTAYNNSQLRVETGKPPLKHGRFTSPHLIDRWDCITIDEKTVSESTFNSVQAKVLQRNKVDNIQATEFELLTATAFEIFTLEKVDIGLVEVGMGGRLDATNILGQLSEFDHLDEPHLHRPKPLVTAISTIALDHQAFLGSTLLDIATQKAGIIKPGVPLVLAPNDPAVTKHIESLALQAGVTQILHAKDTAGFATTTTTTTLDATQTRQQNGAMAFTITWLALKQLSRLASPPTTQAACGSSTLHTQISTSSQSHLASTLRAIPKTLTWPGRLQDLSLQTLTNYNPTVLVDGAHNAESATVLANTVAARRTTTHSNHRRPVVWVLAASQGKDMASMFTLLFAGSRTSRHVVVATEFGAVDGMPWVCAARAQEVRDTALRVLGAEGKDAEGKDAEGKDDEGNNPVVLTESLVGVALERASRIAEEMDALLVVAGSLYLVGDVLRLVRDSGGKID
jgi:folylpolyglutamate synthase/dihydrofolate synthase